MSTRLDECPFCGHTVMKGAMRCTACGRILQTHKERADTIRKLQSRGRFSIKRFIRIIVYITILAILYYLFSDRIMESIKTFTGR